MTRFQGWIQYFKSGFVFNVLQWISQPWDFPWQFLIAVPSGSHTTFFQIHMAACIPLMFSLWYTDILTGVQKYGVSPMFVCLDYILLCEHGNEGTKPWPGCVLLKNKVVINVLLCEIFLHLHLTSGGWDIDCFWLLWFCVSDTVW